MQANKYLNILQILSIIYYSKVFFVSPEFLSISHSPFFLFVHRTIRFTLYVGIYWISLSVAFEKVFVDICGWGAVRGTRRTNGPVFIFTNCFVILFVCLSLNKLMSIHITMFKALIKFIISLLSMSQALLEHIIIFTYIFLLFLIGWIFIMFISISLLGFAVIQFRICFLILTWEQMVKNIVDIFLLRYFRTKYNQ